MIISRVSNEELEMVEDVVEETRNCFVWLFRQIKKLRNKKKNKSN